MVASSVQLNAGKVGLCDLTPRRSFSTTATLRPGVPPVPTAALSCNLVHRTWNKTVDEPHVSQRGLVKCVAISCAD